MSFLTVNRPGEAMPTPLRVLHHGQIPGKNIRLRVAADPVTRLYHVEIDFLTTRRQDNLTVPIEESPPWDLISTSEMRRIDEAIDKHLAAIPAEGRT